MSSALFRAFGTDQNAEQEGVWLDVGIVDTIDGETVSVEFHCRRSGGANATYNKVMERRTKKHRKKIAKGTIELEIAKQISIDVFLDSVLIGWRNLRGEDGELLEFSRENAVALFKLMPDLLTELNEMAGDMEVFRVIEGDAKN